MNISRDLVNSFQEEKPHVALPDAVLCESFCWCGSLFVVPDTVVATVFHIDDALCVKGFDVSVKEDTVVSGAMDEGVGSSFPRRIDICGLVFMGRVHLPVSCVFSFPRFYIESKGRIDAGVFGE